MRSGREELENERVKYKALWRMSCEQLNKHDEIIARKEQEIRELRLARSSVPPAVDTSGTPALSPSDTPLRAVVPEFRPTSTTIRSPPVQTGTPSRRGKAPPVDTFSGDNNFEDWLPALRRAATWNAWSNEETLLQLAGHLRGRALEE